MTDIIVLLDEEKFDVIIPKVENLLNKFENKNFQLQVKNLGKNTYGNAQIYQKNGRIKIPVNSNIKRREKNIRTAIIHEILHRLSATVNKKGGDLIMPVQDWIDFIKSRNIERISYRGKNVLVENYLSISIHGLKKISTKAAYNYFCEIWEIVANIGDGTGDKHYNKIFPSLEIMKRNLLRIGNVSYWRENNAWMGGSERGINIADLKLQKQVGQNL